MTLIRRSTRSLLGVGHCHRLITSVRDCYPPAPKCVAQFLGDADPPQQHASTFRGHGVELLVVVDIS